MFCLFILVWVHPAGPDVTFYVSFGVFYTVCCLQVQGADSQKQNILQIESRLSQIKQGVQYKTINLKTYLIKQP